MPKLAGDTETALAYLEWSVIADALARYQQQPDIDSQKAHVAGDLETRIRHRLATVPEIHRPH